MILEVAIKTPPLLVWHTFKYSTFLTIFYYQAAKFATGFYILYYSKSYIQLDYDAKPFTFADILILRYLLGFTDAQQTVKVFDTVNETSDLNWLFRSQLTKFIKRFVAEPYKKEEKEWFEQWTTENDINAMAKFRALRDVLK